jgi:topoisomerase IV subunit A
VMVTAEDVLVTLSREGYIKRTSMLSFTRSGGELEGSGVKEGDVVRHVLEVNTIENLLLFTKKGQFFLLPVHQIPEFKWKDAGTALVNIVPLQKDDGIVSVIPVKDFDQPNASLVFVTKRGQVKRTELKEYKASRSTAIAACKVADGDEVLTVAVSDGGKEILFVSALGMSIRFAESEVNPMGRVASGVRGIQLKEGDEVAAALWVEGDEGEVLVVTDLGYAKRTLLFDYPVQGRGGKGVITFEFKEGKRVKPNGDRLVGAIHCKEEREIVMLAASGTVLGFLSEKTPIEDRKSIGRAMGAVEKKDPIVSVYPRFGLRE